MYEALHFRSNCSTYPVTDFVEGSPPLYTLMATCYDIATIFKHIWTFLLCSDTISHLEWAWGMCLNMIPVPKLDHIVLLLLDDSPQVSDNPMRSPPSLTYFSWRGSHPPRHRPLATREYDSKLIGPYYPYPKPGQVIVLKLSASTLWV